VGVVTSSSGIAVIDLSKAQTFTLTPTEAISFFRLLNPPTESTSFTLKILQGATAYSVGINTFKNNASVAIPVYWPTGGVLPIVTLTANATDIYSFNIFNGSTITSTGIYGVVVGQNFA
jgi:hypothetical protein